MNATINRFSPTQLVRGTEALQDIIKVVMFTLLNSNINVTGCVVSTKQLYSSVIFVNEN